jgi:curli biogenesis system outer membrane secretion channel CsgG
MNRNGLAFFVATLCLPMVGAVVAPSPVHAQTVAAKKRLAVLDFDLGQDLPRWWEQEPGKNNVGANWNVGRSLVALVESALVTDATFSVYSRKQLDAVLKEKTVNAQDPKMRSTIGSVAGVGAIVTGTITQFGFETNNKSGGGVLPGLGRVFGGRGGSLIAGLFREKEDKAKVVVTLQIIDVASGEILVTATGSGESKRKSKNIIGGLIGSGGIVAGGIDMSSSDFQNTIIGEATAACVASMVEKLRAAESKVPSIARNLSGKVADVDADSLIITIGSDQGLQVGDVLHVERIVKLVKDPDTGEVIDEKTMPVGTITITSVSAKTGSGRFIGSGKPQVGDRVKTK